MRKELSETLSKMGIFELREFARRAGVSSPTTKKREELVSSIKDILTGQAKKQEPTNKGRPPKSINFGQNTYYDSMIPDEFKKIPKKIDNEIVFKDCEADEVILDNVCGYLKISSENNYYFKNERIYSTFKNVFVPKHLLPKNYMIGDYIQAEAMGEEDGTYCVLTRIVSCTSSPETKLDINKLVYSENKIEKLNIMEGTINFVQVYDMKKYIENINSDAQFLQSKKYVPIFTSQSLGPRNYSTLLSGFPGMYFVSLYDNYLETAEEVTLTLKDYLISRLTRGDKIVLFVYGINNSIDTYDEYFGAKGRPIVKGHTAESVQLLRAIFGLARQIEGGGSITIIAGDEDLESDNIKEVKKFM